MRRIISLLALGAALTSAILGLYAAGIDIRDNMDALISDLRRQSYWASWAAAAAGASAAAQALDRFLEK